MADDDIILFALQASRAFGEKVGARLGVTLADHEERDFEDGEHKSRPLVNVRGRDVFVVHSLFNDGEQTVNDKLCRLLFFLAAVKDAAARSVTAVVPYLCYARKDRKTKPRDPVMTRYVAQMFEAVGTDRVITIDVHNLAAFQNAFRCAAENLRAMGLFVDHFAPLLRDEQVMVISPDIGGAKRANEFGEALGRALGREVPMAFVEKYRSQGVVTGGAFVGASVEGRVAIVIDDLISTGGTMLRAARACRELGARKVYAAATHGVFVGDANDVVADEALERVVITDTLPPFRLRPDIAEKKLVVLDGAALFAEAIKRIREGGSLTELTSF